MKKNLFLILLTIFLTLPLLAQKPQNEELKKLSQQVVALDKAGKFDEAIALAEKIVRTEKDSKSSNLETYALVLDNLARLKEKRIAADTIAINSGDLTDPKKKNEILERRAVDIRDVGKFFGDILTIYSDKLKTETTHTASVKRAFAKFLYTHWYYRYSEYVEKYYSEAMSTNERLLGEKDGKTLSAIFEFAEYYFQVLELEKALELFEKYIRIIEKNYGEHQLLVSALRYQKRILAATNQEDEAKQITERISKMTGKEEDTESKPINISARSKDSKLTLKKGLREGQNPSTADATSAAAFRNYSVKENLSGIISITSPVQISGNLVEVLIDENGKVESVKALVKEEKLANRIEKDVSGWNFRPFVYKEKPRKMKGIIIYLD